MATKVTILGGITKSTPKRIEFNKFLTTGAVLKTAHDDPSNYDNIELIALNYALKLDLMFAYNTNRNGGVLYLGKFNDGVVF